MLEKLIKKMEDNIDSDDFELMHTVWMLNRICNGKNSPDKFRKLLAETAERKDIDHAIAKSAKEFCC